MSDLVKKSSELPEKEPREILYGKVLDLNASTPNIDLRGLVNKLCQYVNIAEVIGTIKTGAEYVVQIPSEFQGGFDKGTYWIMENSKTGVQWPSLMELGADGKNHIVTPLPVKKREFIQNNPVKEITDHYHNLYMQEQINELAGMMEATLDTVKRIEHGQMDDRIGLLNAGRQGVILALSQKDEASRPGALLNAANNINIAQNQILETFKRRVSEFKPLPKNTFMQFLWEFTKTGYLEGKDEEYGNILEYYSLYLQATRMLADSYAITGDTGNAQRVFDMAVAQLQTIDYSNLKTIEYAHKNNSVEKLYENAAQFMLAEKQAHMDMVQRYDCLTISVSGAKLLEVLEDGKISEQEAE